MTRWLWMLMSALAVTILLFLALHGPDRGPSLIDHTADGLMKHLAISAVSAVSVTSNGSSRSFTRDADDKWLLTSGAVVTNNSNASTAIEAGLRLFQNSVPQRSFEVELPEFGMFESTLKVLVRSVDGQTFEATFGTANPMGMARYARISSAGRATVHLMPSYVFDAWMQVVLGEPR
ncbi:MAG: hypothetical protein Q7T21_12420 [Gallionella sp.]|nr:hypothetical protein [Gallionella sp.]